VKQQGSYVGPEYFRFDFSHGDALTSEQLATIEHLVTQRIIENEDLTARITDIDTASAEGAMALFGEKYGDQVRMVAIGDYSKELCGGTHSHHTGDIGPFKITSESSVAAGIRRIEALTGTGALEYFQNQERTLKETAALLKTTPHALAERIHKLLEQQKELEKEKLNSELAFLKNQVSPHFFFNTLNNIYALIEVNSNNAQEAVLKLSKLMRYLLYESEQGETQLDSEIDFMNHYIDLMKLRLSPKVDLQVDLPTENTNKKVPPLLFIPFIENAFKHGISYREKSLIHISLKMDDDKIVFSCNNSLGKPSEEKPVENHSGIGLENVKKRLNLLFPAKHKLNIDQTNNEYIVYLEIVIN